MGLGAGDFNRCIRVKCDGCMLSPPSAVRSRLTTESEAQLCAVQAEILQFRNLTRQG